MQESLQTAASDSPLTVFVLAASALGTAAFGIVDGLKWFPMVGEAGFPHVKKLLSSGFSKSLELAYGPDVTALLQAQYRSPNSREELTRTLRQGIRLGLRPETAVQLAKTVGDVVAPDALLEIAKAIQGAEQRHRDGDGGPPQEEALSDAQRGLLGRFELAVDMRIDAALTRSEDTYRNTSRTWAAFIAVALAICTALSLQMYSAVELARAALVGVVAVPVAPIAKDIAAGIAAATKAFGTRK